MMEDTGPRLIVALDYDQVDNCLALVDQLNPDECRLKVGNELFTTGGPLLVEGLVGKGFDVFLDLKYHDIPNTVAQAVKAASRLGVWMMNVHASGGERMLVAAREAIDSMGGHRPLLVGVTVLTSLDADDLAQIGVSRTVEEQVLSLAKLAQQSGLDGVVCSAREVGQLKETLGQGFLTVTPGIRPHSPTGANEKQDDQRRTLSPEQAVEAGSNYIVVGRPITAADNPAEASRRIVASIADL